MHYGYIGLGNLGAGCAGCLLDGGFELTVHDLTRAARHSPELRIAMETWKEIKFEFDTVDKLDVQHR